MALNKKGGLGKGLGKGIDSLISNAYAVETKKKDSAAADKKEPETTVKLRLVEPASSQPRQKFDEDALTELAESIKKYGVIQPIVVKKIEDHYQIIAGERRWRAAKQAGLKDIPVIIKDYDEQQIAEIALIENLQREELNPIEEALAYRSLIKNYEVTQEEISEAVGKSRPHITNTLRLLNLPQKIMDMIDQGQITAGHGKALLRVNDENLQLELANKVIAEELSVRATEALAKKICEDNIKEVPKKSKEKDVFIVDVEEKLRNIFGTKVNISKGKKKGKIEIEYYNEDDLNNIVSMLLEDN